jgi:predicted O-methyltransferase YrrM
MKKQMVAEQLAKIEAYYRKLVEFLRTASESGKVDKVQELMLLTGDLIDYYRRNWKLDMDWAYGELLKSLKSPADLLVASAREIQQRGCTEAALHLAEAAVKLDDGFRFQLFFAELQRRAGRIESARATCRNLLSGQPSCHALSELFMCHVAERLWKQDYFDILSLIHRKRQPRVYLEIGVATGKSLALAKAGTRALGIDPSLAGPNIHVYHSPENVPQLYGMASDDFFASQDLICEMGQDNFDVAFIDGLHHFDQALKDFINLEKFSGKDSVILIHDCIPVDPRVASRVQNTAFWTGDVWKIIPCLKTVRPDLEIVTLPVPPSGLAVIRRLDSTSTLLVRQFHNIVEQFDSLELPVTWPERFQLLSATTDEGAFDIKSYFPDGGWQ